MNRIEKTAYIDQHLTNLTAAQKAECNNQVIWGSDAEFIEWVADAKKRYQSQATTEEIGVVMSHMQGAGNNSSKQFFADQALKKTKEDQLLKDAMSHMKV